MKYASFNNIQNGFCFHRFRITVFLTLTILLCKGQSTSVLKVVDEYKFYVEQLRDDPESQMVELRSVIPGIKYDLRYATINNFTSSKLYRKGNKTFLRLPVAKKLSEVQRELNQAGYGVQIYDAYRPYSTTKKMWEMIKDERYVANPANGSFHNRGLAVDLTLIDVATGKELDMGTDFDNFTDSAHQDFMNFSREILKNREVLRETMEKHGFRSINTEWWHYTWADGKIFDILDLDFKALCRGIKKR